MSYFNNDAQLEKAQSVRQQVGRSDTNAYQYDNLQKTVVDYYHARLNDPKYASHAQRFTDKYGYTPAQFKLTANFAREMARQNALNPEAHEGSHDTRSSQEVLSDNFRGKLGEWATYNYLKDRGHECTKPTLWVNGSQHKGDPGVDLKAGNANLEIKSFAPQSRMIMLEQAKWKYVPKSGKIPDDIADRYSNDPKALNKLRGHVVNVDAKGKVKGIVPDVFIGVHVGGTGYRDKLFKNGLKGERGDKTKFNPVVAEPFSYMTGQTLKKAVKNQQSLFHKYVATSHDLRYTLNKSDLYSPKGQPMHLHTSNYEFPTHYYINQGRNGLYYTNKTYLNPKAVTDKNYMVFAHNVFLDKQNVDPFITAQQTSLSDYVKQVNHDKKVHSKYVTTETISKGCTTMVDKLDDDLKESDVDWNTVTFDSQVASTSLSKPFNQIIRLRSDENSTDKFHRLAVSPDPIDTIKVMKLTSDPTVDNRGYRTVHNIEAKKMTMFLGAYYADVRSAKHRHNPNISNKVPKASVIKYLNRQATELQKKSFVSSKPSIWKPSDTVDYKKYVKNIQKFNVATDTGLRDYQQLRKAHPKEARQLDQRSEAVNKFNARRADNEKAMNAERQRRINRNQETSISR